MKNIQRMMTRSILTTAFIAMMAMLLSSELMAQVVPSPEFMTEIEKASDLYDNRGYQKDKAVNADGKIMVSKTNGNLQYRYDLSSYSSHGYPISFSLNYNQNTSYTSFRAYNGTANAWEQMKQNRPAWILGVNGFAVQALTSTKRPLLAPEMRTNTGTYTSATFDDNDVIWMLDGYDYCNRMNDISVLPSGQTTYVDVIRLLREDGSVLELYHVEKQLCNGSTPGLAARVTGTYISANANSSAYAIVKTDIGLLSPAVRAELIMRYTTEANIPADRLPRRVEYYPGDGLAYVFREWTTPYGIEPYQDNIEVVDAVSGHAGGEIAGPTIFYLVSILHNNTNLVDFDYDSHIIGGTSYVATNQLRQRGHGMLRGFDGHTLTWGLNDLTIDAIGKQIVIEFNDAIYGGRVEQHIRNLKCAPPLVNDGPWSDPTQYASWTGLVTGIVDPVGRKTTFEYDETKKEVQKCEYPFKKIKGNYSACPNVDVSCAVLTLASKRMKTVKELDVKYGLTWDHEPATTTQVLASPIPAPGTEMDIVNGTLSQIVKDLKKYDVETNTHLTTENYLVNVHVPTDPNKRSFKSTITYTDVVGARTKTERMTTEVISLGYAEAGWPKVSHSDVTSHEMEAEGTIERTITGYVEVPAWTSGKHSNIRLPGSIEKTTIVGATTLPRTRQEFTYTVGTTPILAYEGGCTESGNTVYANVVKMFGHAVDKKTELLKVWNSGAWASDLKTVTEFKHLPRAETTLTITYWDKHASYAAFLAYVSTRSPAWTKERATEEWNMTNENSAWIRWWTNPITTVFATPPLFNLTKSVELQDPNNGNAVLKRIETDYNESGFRTVGTGARPNLTYGKQTVQRTYGAGLTNVITTTLGYVPSDSWTISDGALPESVTDAMGAVTKFNYQPLDGAWLSGLGVSSTGVVSAKTLYHNHVGAGTPTNVSLRSLGTAMYEKPSVTERRVRKYLTGGGSLQTSSLASFQTYTHYGLPEQVVDENGYLSRFRYDGIGRLHYAWLPGDFPTAPPTTYDWHAYDVLDNVRIYDANGYAAMAVT